MEQTKTIRLDIFINHKQFERNVKVNDSLSLIEILSQSMAGKEFTYIENNPLYKMSDDEYWIRQGFVKRDELFKCEYLKPDVVKTSEHVFAPMELVVEDFNGHVESIDFSTSIEGLIAKGYTGEKTNHIKAIYYKEQGASLDDLKILFNFERYYEYVNDKDCIQVVYRFFS